MENCDLLPIIFDIVVGLLFPSKLTNSVKWKGFIISFLEFFPEKSGWIK